MNDITKLFESLLDDFRSVDVASREFDRMIDEDPELMASYTEWCEENGHSLRYGFTDFAEEYIENQNSIWDSLTDYDSKE